MAISAIEAINKAEQQAAQIISAANDASAKAQSSAYTMGEDLKARLIATANETVDNYKKELALKETQKRIELKEQNDEDIDIIRADAAKNMDKAVFEILGGL